MESLFTYSVSVFMSFFAIMNPIANTPIFLGLVEGDSSENKKKIALTGTITAFVIVLSFMIGGKYIFELFDITIPAFKLSGGILIFYVGFEMLMSQKSKIHQNNEDNSSSIGISPLAIPILAGPGTIVTAMNNVTNASYVHVGIVAAIFALLIFLTYLAFIYSEKIVDIVGPNLIAVIGKLMGLILTIIGIGMITEGIKLTFGLDQNSI